MHCAASLMAGEPLPCETETISGSRIELAIERGQENVVQSFRVHTDAVWDEIWATMSRSGALRSSPSHVKGLAEQKL